MADMNKQDNPDIVTPETETDAPKGQKDKEEKKGKKWMVLKIALVVVGVIIILLLLLRGCVGGDGSILSETGLSPILTGQGFRFSTEQDKGAQDVTEKSQEDIQNELNSQLENNNTAYECWQSLTVKEGETLASYHVVNAETNEYDQVLRLYLRNEDDTVGKQVAISGAIPPGKEINSITLDQTFKKGTYKAYAMLDSIDAEGYSTTASRMSFLVDIVVY